MKYLMAIFYSVLISFVLLSCNSRENHTDNISTAGTNQATDSLPIDSAFVNYSQDAVKGAVVYVPVYSHIYQRNAQRTFNLTATLSIRNTDLRSSITIRKVYYYDSKGKLVQKYLDSPVKIAPLSSISFVVEEDDLRGGVGANFLVLWEAVNRSTQPVIEAVMISAAQNQGISFVSEGRILDELESNTAQ